MSILTCGACSHVTQRPDNYQPNHPTIPVILSTAAKISACSAPQLNPLSFPPCQTLCMTDFKSLRLQVLPQILHVHLMACLQTGYYPLLPTILCISRTGSWISLVGPAWLLWYSAAVAGQITSAVRIRKIGVTNIMVLLQFI
jgi:hypothetical protein